MIQLDPNNIGRVDRTPQEILNVERKKAHDRVLVLKQIYNRTVVNVMMFERCDTCERKDLISNGQT